MQFLVEFVFPE